MGKRIDGRSKTRLYKTWCNMRNRCSLPSTREYENYGGRGISVCEEWNNSFDAFREWANQNGYEEDAEYGKCTIDRIDVDKGYSPDNCRWISNAEQQANTRKNVYITYNGQTHHLREWERRTGISLECIRKRMRRGMSADEIFETPVIENKKFYLELNGERKTVKEWAKITGLSEKCLYSRHELGWTDEAVILTPKWGKGEKRASNCKQ